MGLFSRKSKELEICAPVNGTVMPTSKLSDPVFAQDMMGAGVAIKPKDGNFVAPFDGEVVVAFPTGHAYGIRAKNGTEVLIHIGMDTVQLNGKGFDVKVKQGDKVQKGDLLVIADLKAIAEAGKPTETPVIVTSGDKDNIKEKNESGSVQAGTVLYKI